MVFVNFSFYLNFQTGSQNIKPYHKKKIAEVDIFLPKLQLFRRTTDFPL